MFRHLFLWITILLLLFIVAEGVRYTEEPGAPKPVFSGPTVVDKADLVDASVSELKISETPKDGGILADRVTEEKSNKALAYLDVSEDAGVDAESDALTEETSGYCGCEVTCCAEFSYDKGSGCWFCKSNPDKDQ